MGYSIHTPSPGIVPPQPQTPLFCFCCIAQDKEAEEILRTKKTVDFLLNPYSQYHD
jgi:hypothetical protein